MQELFIRNKTQQQQQQKEIFYIYIYILTKSNLVTIYRTENETKSSYYIALVATTGKECSPFCQNIPSKVYDLTFSIYAFNKPEISNMYIVTIRT